MPHAPEYAEGGYIGKVTSQAMVKSSNKGTPQFVIQFNVVSKSDGEAVPVHSRKIYKPITAGTAQYVKEMLDTLGFTGTSMKLLDPSTPGFFDLKDREIAVYVKHKADTENNIREEWNISRQFGIDGEPVEDFSAIDELMGLSGKVAPVSPKANAGKVASTGGVKSAVMASGSATSASPSNGAVPISDDDLALLIAEGIGHGNSMPKGSIKLKVLLKSGVHKDCYAKAGSEEFLKAYHDKLWVYDGTNVTVQ